MATEPLRGISYIPFKESQGPPRSITKNSTFDFTLPLNSTGGSPPKSFILEVFPGYFSKVLIRPLPLNDLGMGFWDLDPP